MTKLIKSSIYKLLRDWTFRITLIIGAALSVFMVLLYLGLDMLDGGTVGSACNGYNFYLSSLTPTQNFGLTVPINLIVFTIGEFTCGTIRNKIIAGNRKSLIYLSLIITGIIFTVVLMAIYFGLSVGLASLIGGFKGRNPDISYELLYQYPLMGLCTYIFIVAFAIFISSSIRSIGGTMPIVIIGILLLYFITFIPSLTGVIFGKERGTGLIIQSWTNPLYGFGILGFSSVGLATAYETDEFIATIVTPLYWTAILIALGIIVFKRKDVK